MLQSAAAGAYQPGRARGSGPWIILFPRLSWPLPVRQVFRTQPTSHDWLAMPISAEQVRAGVLLLRAPQWPRAAFPSPSGQSNIRFIFHFLSLGQSSQPLSPSHLPRGRCRQPTHRPGQARQDAGSGDCSRRRRRERLNSLLWCKRKLLLLLLGTPPKKRIGNAPCSSAFWLGQHTARPDASLPNPTLQHLFDVARPSRRANETAALRNPDPTLLLAFCSIHSA